MSPRLRVLTRALLVELWSMSSAMEEKEVAVKFVKLQDGRQIAYREQGVTAPDATRRSLLVLHGIASSCLAGMPGVSDDLLKELNVRLVAIDQPGYGRSDKNPKQTMATFAKDIAELADLLQLGEKFWLLGYYFGGAYTGQLHTISLNAVQELQCGHLLVITGGRIYRG